MQIDRRGLGRIGAVAQNTTREALRNRAFIALSVSAVAFIIFSMVLSELAVVGQGSRVILNFGFFAISLFVAVTAIVMGAVMLYKEVDKKTIYTIISKPVQRYEFVLGKYLGLLAILAVELLALAVVWVLVILSDGGEISAGQISGIVLIFFEAMVITGIAVMFSAMTNPALTALFTTGCFAVGRVVYIVDEMLSASQGVFVDNEWARPIGEAVAGAFPDLGVFNVSQQVLWGVDVSGAYVTQAGLYALGYTAIFLVLAVFAFQRRDFV
jgi:ABC-type transport system involved in multi-copper enzyme maturation permease subunit